MLGVLRMSALTAAAAGDWTLMDGVLTTKRQEMLIIVEPRLLLC